MRILGAIAGLVLLAGILFDSFETIILPRRVTRYFRLTRLFYRYTWASWGGVARRMRPGRRRETFLSYFGPLSLLQLFLLWAVGLIFAFALLQWGAGSAVNTGGQSRSFATDLYFSGTSFFTLGIGDVTPRSALARFITVVESGTGFGILAIVISYLPVLYAAFSQREANITLMDARAGSPPTAAELLIRHAQVADAGELVQYLREWEIWTSQLMESHLSYPILGFFRSQHSNQSWLASLAVILDTCAFLMTFTRGRFRRQAHFTFAICRHAVVDLAQVVYTPPLEPAEDRLPGEALEHLKATLAAAGLSIDHAVRHEALNKIRQTYEPYLYGLSEWFLMPLPPWSFARESTDNWQHSAWRQPASLSLRLARAKTPDRGDGE
jgi:Ion channel